ncbi:TonB-dependent Receptor Plug Domain protein [compost metagenome]
MNRLKSMLLVTSMLAGSMLSAQQLSYQGKPTLKELFSVIRQQTGYNIIASANQIDLDTVVKIKAKDKALRDVLEEAFKDLPLTFKIVGKEITILREEKTEQKPKQQKTAQQLFANGTVRDKSGPVELVTIYNKSNDKVTFTNEKGAFSIERTNHTDTLFFSSIGYEERQFVLPAGQQTIDMQLLQTQTVLDEVSVLSYGQQVSKRLNTGSTSGVTAATIEKTPTADPLIALQNRVPGLLINTPSGLPGVQTQVQIRGINTVNQDGNAQQPLFIVDGIPFNNNSLAYLGANGLTSSILGESPLKSIDPTTIASIEVLKDADATAIYGARGANGVILITTKRGKVGRPTFSADYYHSFASIGHYMKMLNTAQYLEMRREAAQNDGIDITPEAYPDLLSWSQTEDHNWQKEYFGNVAHTSNAELSLSGGSSRFNYLLGGGFRRENTVYDKKNGLSIGNFRSNLDYNSADGRFTAALSASYATDKNDIIPLSFNSFLTLPPNYTLYNPDGELNWALQENPIAQQKRTIENKTKNLISNVGLSYRILPNLVAKINTGYTRMKINQMALNPRSSFNPAYTTPGNNTFTDASTATFNFEPQLDYDLVIGRNAFRALLGGTYINSENESITKSGGDYMDDSLLEDINAAGRIDILQSQTQYRFLSGFARLGWTFDQKYVVNGTIRRDGSSRFGPGNKYGNFWSVGAAWILSEENWLKDNHIGLSFAKLRGSYGLTGNDNIGDYSYFVNYERSLDNYLGQGFYPKNLFNANYRWEVNKKLDLAAEMGFLKDRIILEVNYYQNRSGNQLVGYGLPTQVGFSSVNQNLDATVQNSGWEFSLQTTPINNLAFTWKTNFTMSINRNKLLAFPDIGGSPYSLTYQVGKPLSLIWGYDFLGINPTDGQPQFRDLNGDGIIAFPDDYTVLSPSIPAFFGGLGNSFNYKNFDLDIFFSFKKNKNAYNYPFSDAGSLVNAPVSVLERWQHPGQEAKFPAYTTNSMAMSNYSSSSANYVDASYIRLSNVTLSYTVPSKFLEKIKLKNLRAYATGANLFTITKFKGTDPETGIDMPMLQTFTLGIRSSF